MLSAEQRRDLLGLGLVGLTLFMALSLVPPWVLGSTGVRLAPSGNLMGALGLGFVSGVRWLVGMGVLLAPLLGALAAAGCFGWLDRTRGLRIGALLGGLVLLLPALAGVGTFAGFGLDRSAGWVGLGLAAPLVAALSWVGAGLLVLFLILALCVATVGWNPLRWSIDIGRGVAAGALALGRAGGSAARRLRAWRESRRRSAPSLAPVNLPGEEPGPFGGPPAPGAVSAAAATAGGFRVGADEAPNERPAGRRAGREADSAELEDTGRPDSEDRPDVDLLTQPESRDVEQGERELDRLGDVLIDTLRTFRVESRITGRTTGPVVTQFEVVPAPGIKVNRIAALDADLALALRAPSVRIVAPIPGKGAVGVEVPNPQPEVVPLREILAAAAFQRHRGALPLALGKDLEGRPYVADLARMPHLLIAGATGSGKSVCINTIITSLVYRHSPSTLRLLLIDPKMVELSMYGALPHLRHPVVTDPRDAATVLKWAVLEMGRRYELLSENGARSVAEFNRRVEQGQPLRRVEPAGEEGDPDRWLYTDGPLPYIVLVVDELADLIMSAQADVERPLAQLAQKARAIGVHLIVATQRPSVNVITGLIKANFPCRIAFRVSSKVDSRTILDQNGADALLGNGDMLFLPPGQADPVRIQGAYLPTEDTERLMAWYRERDLRPREAEREDDILEYVRAREAADGGDDQDELALDDRDPLFRQAAEVCIQFQQGSTSLLQRRLRIGYGRAARIIDQLHQAGVLGPADGSKAREVLVGMESLDHIVGGS